MLSFILLHGQFNRLISTNRSGNQQGGDRPKWNGITKAGISFDHGTL